MMKNLIYLALIAFTMLINLQIAAACDISRVSSVNFVYVEKFHAGSDAGAIVKKYTDHIKSIVQQPSFHNVSEISEALSLQPYREGEADDIVITLSFSLDPSYEAITQLTNSKDYIAIDIHERLQLANEQHS
ncbi:hypothetical protein [Vibrio sp. SCSIO 43136]|uniref:hypothetical protein n=1 Tax=Vibrio sp. SCSIO 43136 TaxID=2819101 RepID=UPI002075C39E|nr:hypothetical protein [Vibrio sp. SCSIO 43136]USD66331.1 hypothetical protein J4N39_05810 [Vibrio sp. SCSIO 43136]